jgi:hypothetical protein
LDLQIRAVWLFRHSQETSLSPKQFSGRVTGSGVQFRLSDCGCQLHPCPRCAGARRTNASPWNITAACVLRHRTAVIPLALSVPERTYKIVRTLPDGQRVLVGSFEDVAKQESASLRLMNTGRATM